MQAGGERNEENILDGIDCRNGLWVCYDKRLNKGNGFYKMDGSRIDGSL